MKNKKKRYGAVSEGRPSYLPQGQFAPRAVGGGYNPTINNARQAVYQSRVEAVRFRSTTSDGVVTQNTEAAVALRAMLRSSVIEQFACI